MISKKSISIWLALICSTLMAENFPSEDVKVAIAERDNCDGAGFLDRQSLELCKEWCGNQNWANTNGVCCFVDSLGNKFLLGVGKAKLTRNNRKYADEIAMLRAKGNLTYALAPNPEISSNKVSATTVLKGVVSVFSTTVGDDCGETRVVVVGRMKTDRQLQTLMDRLKD